MKLPAHVTLGAATHTGLQRSANEDDYLVVALPPVPGGPGRLLVAVADGMGGAAGGAEASRAALRALAASLLRTGSVDAEERMRQAFAAACTRVHEQSREVPSLRDMGSTLTALLLQDGQVVIGHVGDTRCLLVREGGLAQMTTDHAVRTPESYLTRCIGGGQATEQPDVATLELLPGDRLVLVTDGVWSTVDPAAMLPVIGSARPQAAAERLVRLANAAGGPDNATCVVLHWAGPEGENPDHEVALPREELSRSAELDWPGGSLQAARWPWLAFALATAVLAVALLRLCGVDLLAWLRSGL